MKSLHVLAKLACSDPLSEISEGPGVLRVTIQKAQLVLAASTVPAGIATILAIRQVFRVPLLATVFAVAALETRVLRSLIGRDQILIEGGVMTIRKSVLGLGVTRTYPLDQVRNLRYIDTLNFENGLRCLYFECQYIPHYFAYGVTPETAAAVIEAVTRVALRVS